MSKKKTFKCCPQCDSKWSNAEMESQECETCGYPRTKISLTDLDDENDEDTGFDYEDDF